MAVEADDVEEGMGVGAFRSGEPGPEEWRRWRQRDKVTGERDTRSDTWGTKIWKESDTERQIIVRTPGGRDEGIRVMETDGGSETQGDVGIKTSGDRAAGREMQGTRDSNRDSWEREISGTRDVEGERIQVERGILRLRQGTQSKEPDQGDSGSRTDGVKGGVMAR